MKSKKNTLHNDVQDQQMKGNKISLEDQVIRNFDEVLESDEKIIKGFKPNFARVFLSRLLLTGIPCLLIAIFGILTFLIPDQQMSYVTALIIMLVAIMLACLMFALSVWFTCLYYKNTYYCYTNKRIIIKTGIFAVDFKSLVFDSIVSSTIYVGLLDKLLRKNTGTVYFKTALNSESQKIEKYIFAHVENASEIEKEIKNYISKQK